MISAARHKHSRSPLETAVGTRQYNRVIIEYRQFQLFANEPRRRQTSFQSWYKDSENLYKKRCLLGIFASRFFSDFLQGKSRCSGAPEKKTLRSVAHLRWATDCSALILQTAIEKNTGQTFTIDATKASQGKVVVMRPVRAIQKTNFISVR